MELVGDVERRQDGDLRGVDRRRVLGDLAHLLVHEAASSRMYAGSPAARTEYVWPKISTCVTTVWRHFFARPVRAAREDSTGHEDGRARRRSSSVLSRRSMRDRTAVRSASCFASSRGGAALFRLASRGRELGLQPGVFRAEALHDVHERFQPRLDGVEDRVEGAFGLLRLAFAPALGLPSWSSSGSGIRSRRRLSRPGSAWRRRTAASRQPFTSSRASERCGDPKRRVIVVFTKPSGTPGPR